MMAAAAERRREDRRRIDRIPSVGSIGQRALLLAASAVTGGALLLAFGQFAIGVNAAREVMLREQQSRALSIMTMTQQMRQVGINVREAHSQIMAPGKRGEGFRDCDTERGIDVEALKPFLAIEPGASEVPPPARLACLLATIREAHALINTGTLQQIGYVGKGWVLAFPAPEPNAQIQARFGESASLTAALLDAAADMAGSRESFFNAPTTFSFNGGTRVISFVASGIARERWSHGAFVSFGIEDFWAQTLPLNGPANEVMLVRADGTIIARGSTLPEDDPGVLPVAGGIQPIIEGRNRVSIASRGTLIGSVHLPDPNWYLVSLVRPVDLFSWLAFRNALTLGVLGGVIALAWLTYFVIARRVLSPARKLERLLTKTLQDLQTTFDNITEGLLLIGNDGRIISSNARVAELLEVEPRLTAAGQALRPLRAAIFGGEQNLTRSDEELIAFLRSDRRGQAPDRDVTVGEGRTVFQHQVETNSYEIKLASGRWVELRISTHADGLIFLYADITRRKQDELAIRKAKEDAEAARVEAEAAREEAVGALARLETAQAQLVESEKMAALGELVAGVAHEVNTPVGVSVTAASSLAERMREVTNALGAETLTKDQLETFLTKGEKTIGLLLDNLGRAAKLVRSFKQVAVDQHIEEPQDLNLKGYLETALVSLRHELKRGQHRLVIEGEDDIHVLLVPAQLWQVTSNLVLNAVNHAFGDRTGGTITITLKTYAGKAVMTVADDGAGMPPEVLKRCFDPFFTTKRGAGGSGLGLSIVRNIVTSAMKGRISATSAPGEGTVFTIEIPLNKAKR